VIHEDREEWREAAAAAAAAAALVSGDDAGCRRHVTLDMKDAFVLKETTNGWDPRFLP
jgi:hypothetical protein